MALTASARTPDLDEKQINISLNLLADAIREENLQKVINLLTNPACRNNINNNIETRLVRSGISFTLHLSALNIACSFYDHKGNPNSIKIIQKLLEVPGIEVNKGDSLFGAGPLHRAIGIDGRLESVKLLCEAKADVNLLTTNEPIRIEGYPQIAHMRRMSPLCLATAYKKPDVAKYLVDHGADVFFTVDVSKYDCLRIGRLCLTRSEYQDLHQHVLDKAKRDSNSELISYLESGQEDCQPVIVKHKPRASALLSPPICLRRGIDGDSAATAIQRPSAPLLGGDGGIDGGDCEPVVTSKPAPTRPSPLRLFTRTLRLGAGIDGDPHAVAATSTRRLSGPLGGGD